MTRVIFVIILLITFVHPVVAKEDPGHWLEDKLTEAGLLVDEPLEVSAMKPAQQPHLLSTFCMQLASQQKNSPERAAILRAFYLIKMGSHYEALRYLGQAICKTPNSKSLHALRVVCYASLGMKSAVVAGLERCLRLEPNCPIARVRLCRALLQRKRSNYLKKAFLAARELIKEKPGLAVEFAKSFPQGKARAYFEERCAQLRVEKAIAQLRTVRPTLCPTYFQKSPKLLPKKAVAQVTEQQPKKQETAKLQEKSD